MTTPDEVTAFVRETITRDFAQELWPLLERVIVLDAGDSQVEMRWLAARHRVCSTRTAALALRRLPDGAVGVERQPFPQTPTLAAIVPDGVVRIVTVDRGLVAEVTVGPPPGVAA
jgi:hypothetical protein